MNIGVDDEGPVSRRSFVPAFHLEDGGLAEVGVHAVPERPLMAFVWVEVCSLMGDGGEGEGEAVVVHGEILHGPNGTSRLSDVAVQGFDCM